MATYFSPSRLAFYDDSLKESYLASGTWPSDGAPISDQTWRTYIAQPPSGQVLGQIGGQPEWVDAPLAVLTVPQALSALVGMLTMKEMAGVYFTPTGASQALLFPTDANAQIKYTAEWNMIGATPPLRTDGDPMITADGTPVALSNADAKALVEKALAYIKGCAANYAVLQPQVLADAATDVSTGWPVNT